MESGAACTLRERERLAATWPKQPRVLYEPDAHQSTRYGETISVLGLATVRIRLEDTVCALPLFVVQEDGAIPLGRNGPLRWALAWPEYARRRLVLLPANIC